MWMWIAKILGILLAWVLAVAIIFLVMKTVKDKKEGKEATSRIEYVEMA